MAGRTGVRRALRRPPAPDTRRRHLPHSQPASPARRCGELQPPAPRRRAAIVLQRDDPSPESAARNATAHPDRAPCGRQALLWTRHRSTHRRSHRLRRPRGAEVGTSSDARTLLIRADSTHRIRGQYRPVQGSASCTTSPISRSTPIAPRCSTAPPSSPECGASGWLRNGTGGSGPPSWRHTARLTDRRCRVDAPRWPGAPVDDTTVSAAMLSSRRCCRPSTAPGGALPRWWSSTATREWARRGCSPSSSTQRAERGVLTLIGHCVDLGDMPPPYLPFTEAFGRLAADAPNLSKPCSRRTPRSPAAATPRCPTGRSRRPRGEDRVDRGELFEAIFGALTTPTRRAAGPARRRGRALGRPGHPRSARLPVHPARQPAGRGRRRASAATTCIAGIRCDRRSRNGRACPASTGCTSTRSVPTTCVRWCARCIPRRWPSRTCAASSPAPTAMPSSPRNSSPPASSTPTVSSCPGSSPTCCSSAWIGCPTRGTRGRPGRRGRRPAHLPRDARRGRRPARGEPWTAALRDAVDAHILEPTPSGRGYTFRHALLAEAVYDDLLPGERVRMHAAYATELAKRPDSSGGRTGAPRPGVARPRDRIRGQRAGRRRGDGPGRSAGGDEPLPGCARARAARRVRAGRPGTPRAGARRRGGGGRLVLPRPAAGA